MEPALRPSLDEVWHWLAQVPDPEIPVISLTDLGIIRDVAWRDDTLVVTVTPTYSGCPATTIINLDIETALAEKGLSKVKLERQLSPAWTTDWISAEGREKLRDYGIAVDPELVVEGDYAFDDGFRGARKLLALPQPPTAIFGSNDEIAAGVLAAARSTGINVPYDLSIAGFEDSPFSKQSWPPLTTAKQATEDIASHAARRLLQEIREQQPPEKPAVPAPNEGFSPQLVVRGSTAPPRPRS